MTGGEHSVTTPLGGITSTTILGQLEKPLDICGTAAINGASFVARTTTFDKNASAIISQAVKNDGFSIVDIWELCTAYYVPNNRFSKKALYETLENLKFPTGIIYNQSKPEYSSAYKDTHAEILGSPMISPKSIRTTYSHNLTKPEEIIIAGAAGTKINSAALLFGYGAVLSGLWVTQRDDYPVTVKSGHSISELKISPFEIRYASVTKPNIMIVLFSEGLAIVQDRIKQLTENDILFISSSLPDVKTLARKNVVDFSKISVWGHKNEYRAVIALTTILKRLDLYPVDAFKKAITMVPKFAKNNLAAVQASLELT
jgi:Pyruvate/2-oxoacid:ferredoxin oxidoreductase gamma subunit